MYDGLEVTPNTQALNGRRTQLGDRVWNDELQAVQVAVMGGWELEAQKMAGKLNGAVFCLTGKMWTTREKVESHIRAAGGHVSRTMRGHVILVQGAVANATRGDGGGKSKKQLDAERNGQRVIDATDLRNVMNGNATMEEVLGASRKPKPKRPPVEPIDREKQNRIVKQVFEDIEAIAFGK